MCTCVQINLLTDVRICRSDASESQEGGEECSHIQEGTTTSKPENGNGSLSVNEDSDDRCTCNLIGWNSLVYSVHMYVRTVDMPPSEAAVSFVIVLLYTLVSLATVALTMNWRGTPLSLGWPHTDTWRGRGRRLGRNQSE